MNKALKALADKYGAPAGEIVKSGDDIKIRCAAGDFSLLPWRVERRFVELARVVENRTVEDVSTIRCSAFAAGGKLPGMAARELDIASWFGGTPVASVFAVAAGAAVNVVAKLANGVNVSVECSAALPADATPMDRHEIIARRGLASDRVVDTQVPQDSIYIFADNGERRYTDTDAELFGLDATGVALVRAAMAVLEKPALGGEWNAAAATLKMLAEAVETSSSSAVVVRL